MSELLGENSRKRKREPSSAPSDVSISGTSTPAQILPVSRSGNAPEILSVPLAATQSLDATTAILPPTTVTPAHGKPPTFTSAPAPSKLFLTSDIPPNRATFRYTPAGPAPPGNLVLHRSVEHSPPGVHFSWEDRSQHVRVSQDGMEVEGFGGFRSARVNVPVREGKWYLEVVIERSESSLSSTAAMNSTKEKENENARVKEGNQVLGKHVRLGWGRHEASLNGPVGLDGYSYGVRDATGEAVTLSLLKPYGSPFKQGDVVGMYISIPSPPRKPSERDDAFDPARLVRKRIPIGLKMGPYFESAEYKVCREMKTLLEEATNTTATVASTAASGASTSKKRKGDARPAKAANSSSDQGPLRPLPILENSKIA
jgi:COMPASS component BRE2